MDLVSLVTGLTGLAGLSGLTGLISGFWVAYTFHRKIQVENVLQERTKWRERMRELGRQIAEKAYLLGRTKEEIEKDKIKAELLGLISELQLRLNPFDNKKDEQKGFYDRQILKLAMKILEKPCCYIFSFEKKMQLLLKWEWERAKKDSSLCSFFKRYGTYQENYKPQLNTFYNVIICFLFVVIFVLVAFFISVLMLKNSVFKDVIIQIKIFLVNL